MLAGCVLWLLGALRAEEFDVDVAHGGAQDGLLADGLVGHLRERSIGR